MGKQQGRALEKSSGLDYLHKESILQSGDVFAVTTDLVRVQDRSYESPTEWGPTHTLIHTLIQDSPKIAKP